MSTATTVPPITSRSTIFGKLPGSILRQVDQAIVDRDHTAYREIYAEHNLPGYHVSFSAFYSYARRLRAQADMLYLAETTLPESTDLAASLPKFFALRVLDAVNNETSTHQQLHSLVDSWRIAANTRIALERHAVALPDPTAVAAKAKEKTNDREARHARLKATLAAFDAQHAISPQVDAPRSEPPTQVEGSARASAPSPSAAPVAGPWLLSEPPTQQLFARTGRDVASSYEFGRTCGRGGRARRGADRAAPAGQQSRHAPRLASTPAELDAKSWQVGGRAQSNASNVNQSRPVVAPQSEPPTPSRGRMAHRRCESRGLCAARWPDQSPRRPGAPGGADGEQTILPILPIIPIALSPLKPPTRP